MRKARVEKEEKERIAKMLADEKPLRHHRRNG